MSELERIDEWLRHYKACILKVNALCAIYENDGEKMLGQVLKRLGLVSAADVVKAESAASVNAIKGRP